MMPIIKLFGRFPPSRKVQHSERPSWDLKASANATTLPWNVYVSVAADDATGLQLSILPTDAVPMPPQLFTYKKPEDGTGADVSLDLQYC